MEQGEGIVLRRAEHLDIEQRVALGKGAEGAEQPPAVDVRNHAERQAAFQSLGEFQRMHLQLGELLGDHPRLRCQGPGQRRRTGFAVGSLEKGETQLRLQVGDAHAHRRRHSTQGTGGAGKGAAVEDGEEQLDGIAGKVHGNSPISRSESC